MSSPLRLFLDDKRVSTAVLVRSGHLLQVYPEKKVFSTEAEWTQHWEEAMKPKFTLRRGDPEPAPVAAPVPTPAAVRPSRSKKYVPASEAIFTILAHQAAQKKPDVKDWNINKINHFTFSLPAGRYYIGDLCYALGDDIYDNIFGGTGYSSGIYEEKDTGRVFLVANTAWGDGEFEGSDGKHFAVDAGIIGICCASLVKKSGEGGHMYTFDTPVKCNFRQGMFSFFYGWHQVLDINTE
jgi:hypothetical protein